MLGQMYTVRLQAVANIVEQSSNSDAAASLHAVEVAALTATDKKEVMLAVADMRAVITMLPSLLLRCVSDTMTTDHRSPACSCCSRQCNFPAV